MKKIAFICVNYNGANITSELIDSLVEQIGIGVDFCVECVVVDNSETLLDMRLLQSKKVNALNLKILRNSHNSGYFPGLNLGMRATSGDFVIVCNNDLLFNNDFCQQLVGLSFNKSIFAIAPNVITKDGYRQNPHVLRRMNFLQKLKLDIYFSNYWIARFLSWMLISIGHKRRNLSRRVDGCEIHMGIGACYILTENFLNNFNQLHYPNFLYGEEAYFSNQIHSAGGVLWYEPKLKLMHMESLSTTKLPKRAAYEYAKSGYPQYRNFL